MGRRLAVLVAMIAGAGLVAPMHTSVAFAAPSSAAAVTWSGAGDGVHWSDPANWTGGAVPGAGANLVFPPGTRATDDLPAGFVIGTVDVTDSILDGHRVRIDHGLTVHGVVTLALDVDALADDDICACWGQIWTLRAGDHLDVRGTLRVVNITHSSGTLFVLADRADDSAPGGALTIHGLVGSISVTGSTTTFSGSWPGPVTASVLDADATVDDWPGLTLSTDRGAIAHPLPISLRVLRTLGTWLANDGTLVVPASTADAPPVIGTILDGNVGLLGIDVTYPGRFVLGTQASVTSRMSVRWNDPDGVSSCDTPRVVVAVAEGATFSLGGAMPVPRTVDVGNERFTYSLTNTGGNGNDVAITCAQGPVPVTSTVTAAASSPSTTVATTGDTLPFTGRATSIPISVGVACVALGGALGLVGGARRRRRELRDART